MRPDPKMRELAASALLQWIFTFANCWPGFLWVRSLTHVMSEIDSTRRLALSSSSRILSSFGWNVMGIKCAITVYVLASTLIGCPMVGQRTFSAFSLSQMAVLQLLDLMSSLLLR